MTQEHLKKKTPKQLLCFLRNYGWKKKAIIELLMTYEGLKEESLKRLTYLELCNSYREEIAEAVFEEMCNY